MLSFLFLVLPGAIVAYALFLRPYARAQFAEFYARADGFWSKAWALSGKSVTLAFGYVCQVVGWLLQWIDPIADLIGESDLRQQITDGLQANPKVLGYVLMGVSFVTIIAKLRRFGQ